MEWDMETYMWYIITTIIFIYGVSQDRLTDDPVYRASTTN